MKIITGEVKKEEVKEAPFKKGDNVIWNRSWNEKWECVVTGVSNDTIGLYVTDPTARTNNRDRWAYDYEVEKVS